MFGDPVREQACLHLDLAKKYLDRGQYDRSVQEATKCLKLKSFSEAYIYRGLAYYKGGEVYHAMEDLKRGLDVMESFFAKGQGSDEILQEYVSGCIALGFCYVQFQSVEEAKKCEEKASMFLVTNKKLKGKELKKLKEDIAKLERMPYNQRQILSQPQDPEEQELQKALEASKNMHQIQDKEDLQVLEAIQRSKKDAVDIFDDDRKVEEQLIPQEEKKQQKKKKQVFEMRPNRATTFEFDSQLRQDQTAQQFGFSELYFGKNGLENLGNTCYMNSVVQCLAGIPEIKNYFLQEMYEPHIIDQSDYELLPEEDLRDLLNTQLPRASIKHLELDELP